jgi:coenzyme F420-reducing hydrogenase alpha subunit
MSRRIHVDYLARVEGEGGLDVFIEDGKIKDLRLNIFEPPRFFEGWLRGRSYMEIPDLTARICGICPVAYQVSGSNAVENAFGAEITKEIRALRRLLYLAEHIESHSLHVYLLAAPDFLGYESAISMAKDHPDVVKRGLRMKRLGNDLMVAIGGREVHPVSPRPGGFYRAPEKEELEPFLPRLSEGLEDAIWTVKFVSKFDIPDLTRDIEFVALRHEEEYGIVDGRIVSNKGIDITPEEYDETFEEIQVPHSTSFHSIVRGRGEYFVGPLARVNLNMDKLSKEAKMAMRECGIPFPNSNPFTSIVARAIELVQAMEESIQIISSYEKPDPPYVELRPRESVGYGVSEAPRGILYHSYKFDEEGRILYAKIVSPTAQNQRQIEADLREWVPRVIDLPMEEATLKCEMAIRNYDPCISCSAHFLKLRIHK